MYYRTLASLQHYLVINQTRQHVEQHTRRDTNRWTLIDFTQPDDRISFSEPACSISLAQIYEAVAFD